MIIMIIMFRHNISTPQFDTLAKTPVEAERTVEINPLPVEKAAKLEPQQQRQPSDMLTTNLNTDAVEGRAVNADDDSLAAPPIDADTRRDAAVAAVAADGSPLINSIRSVDARVAPPLDAAAIESNETSVDSSVDSAVDSTVDSAVDSTVDSAVDSPADTFVRGPHFAQPGALTIRKLRMPADSRRL